MRIKLELPRYKEIRIWLDDLPDLSYTAERIFEHSLHSSNSTIVEIRSAAVEVFTPQGGRALYGLLGAELSPNHDDTVIKLHVASNLELTFNDSIRPVSDNTRVGLPEEYVKSVIKGVCEVIEQEKEFPTSIITFNRAVHDIVGSSEYVFYNLSKVVTRLLINYPKGEDIEKFFQLKE